jgi:transcriptional regulator GlxA family with amidase domain
MHVVILTFQGFNELDSFVALGVLNRIKKPRWRVTRCCSQPTVTSMNGVTVHAQSLLGEVVAADAVIVGSGIQTQESVNETAIMSALHYVAPVGEKDDYVNRAMKNI